LNNNLTSFNSNLKINISAEFDILQIPSGFELIHFHSAQRYMLENVYILFNTKSICNANSDIIELINYLIVGLLRN
jgi:hypothetical protein